MNIKKDDLVVIITGDDADPARAHRVLRVMREAGKLVVEGIKESRFVMMKDATDAAETLRARSDAFAACALPTPLAHLG